MLGERGQERRKSRAFRTHRFVGLAALVFPAVALLASRLRGIEICAELHLCVLLFWGLPACLSALAAEAGFISSSSEIFIGEMCHGLIHAVLLPLRLAVVPGLKSVDVVNSVLLGLPSSTAQRAVLSTLRAQTGLTNLSLFTQLFLSIGPLTISYLFRTLYEEVLSPEMRDSLTFYAVCNTMVVVAFLTKVVDLEELIKEISTSLQDKQLLLQAAFDATCHLTVQPLEPSRVVPANFSLQRGPLHPQVEQKGLTLAGQLRVTSSSPGMDSLFAEKMVGQALDQSRVVSGLPALTELVTRAGQAPSESHGAQGVLLSCRDKYQQEFELEVRVVRGVTGTVLCGIRSMGEKRVSLQESMEDSEALQEVLEAVPVGSGLVTRLLEAWEWLRADPPPPRWVDSAELLAQPPVSQAVWRALRCVPNLLALRCKHPSLDIQEASIGACTELAGVLIGRSAPILLAQAEVAQHFRSAVEVVLSLKRHTIATEGCYCHEFGTVVLTSLRGPLKVKVDLIFLPGTEASVVVLFHPVRRQTLRLPSSRCFSTGSAEIRPEDSVSNGGLRARALRTRGAMSVSWASEE